MLSFHPLSLADKPWIDRHVREENSRSADFNFGNMFLWDGKYRQLVSDSGRHLISLACSGDEPIFPFPIGCGELRPAIEDMREYALALDFPLVIRGLEERHVAALSELYPGRFDFTEDRDYSDYIYPAEALATLGGKALHGKRNHCNRFEAEHSWRFEALGPEHFSACAALLRAWESENVDADGSIANEHAAIARAFEYFEPLELFGGALFAEDELIGFTIGEKISSDTFDVHFEKARADINGAYPMLCRELVRSVVSRWPEIHYVNREDDMGLENLRRSKLSWRPCEILKKFSAHWRYENG